MAGTWLTVKTTSDYLLYQSATRAAQNWANYLAANVADLEQIAAGEAPSSASLEFFRNARKSGQVFRYTIFNRYGYSMLSADREKVTPLELSAYDPVAAQSVKQSRPVVGAHTGLAPGQPDYYANAYVPVMVDGQPVAIVTAYVDQTDERNSFYRVFLAAAATLCLLTAFSFGLPAWAWYRRTQEKQEADRRVQYLAHHDALTGLANRGRLIEALENQLVVLPSTGTMLAVHIIDIDQFKDINDTLGHDAGDFLLGGIARRLMTMTRTEDIVARLGGDEFIVVQTGMRGRSQADAFSQRIMAILRTPIPCKDQEISVNFTIGVAVAPSDGVTAVQLLKNAELALYSGKAGGRNCIRFFSAELDDARQARVKLEKFIRDAVAHESFVLHYQPLFEIVGRRLVGFEALARLPAPDGTLISPTIFIPIAEELRLIDRLGAWVLREACRAATTWPEHLTVAVNLSPAQFDSGQVEKAVADALTESHLAAHRLELEITENLLLVHTDQTLAVLGRLKDLGTAIVMDDFGIGYSSLSYLWKFPFDKIKIDRSFMEGFGKAGRDVGTVVKSIIALGRELNMRVTVEGVETAAQADFLSEANADEVQGFFFGMPVPATEVSADILKNFGETQKPAAAPEPDDRQKASGGR